MIFAFGSTFGQGFSFKCAKDTVVCGSDPCFTLKTRIPDIRTQTTDYEVNALSSTEGCFIPYAETSTPGPSASITGDDDYSAAIDITFPFSFYGTTYNKLIISDNGFISFDISKAGGFSHWGITSSAGSLTSSGTPLNLPSTLYDKAIIMGPYHDLYMPATTSPNRKIKYEVVGDAPHRRFIVSYYKIPMFSCNDSIENTHQIVLYEGLNVVEVFVNSVQNCSGWNKGRAMIGMQDETRTKFIMAPGRKASDLPWGRVNMDESWRFVPSAGPSLFQGVELFDANGVFLSTGVATPINSTTLDVVFPTICDATSIGQAVYIIKSKYISPTNPGTFEYGTDTVTVYRNLPNPTITPSVSLTSNDTITVCQNSTVNLSATGLINGAYYVWFNAPRDSIQSTTTFTPNTSTPGVYTYYLRQRSGCIESGEVAITIVVKEIPQVNPNDVTFNGSANNHFCANTNGSVVLLATPSDPTYQIDWYDDSTVSPIAPASFSYNTPGSLTDTTTYYLTQTTIIRPETPTDPGLACRSPFFYPVTIFVDSLPNQPSVNPGTRCGPGSVTLSNNPRSNETVEWYAADLPDPSGNIGSGNSFITAALNDTTVFYAQAINTVTNCKSPIRTPDTAYIRTIPGLGADKDTSICYGDSINIVLMIDTSNLGLTSADWSINGNLIPAPYFVSETGEYQLEVNTPENCPDIAMLNLTVMPKVNAFAGNDTIAILGGEHTLLGNGGVSYLWSPTTFLKNIADSNKKNPVVILNNDQLFVMTVANAIGCKEKDSVFVKVLPGPDYNTPNAFSPNGDGLNDIFRVVPSGISYTEWFKIYNRNGELVFQTNKWLAGWDGTKNGKIQPDGTYVWIVKGMDKNGKVVIRKGTVMLIH